MLETCLSICPQINIYFDDNQNFWTTRVMSGLNYIRRCTLRIYFREMKISRRLAIAVQYGGKWCNNVLAESANKIALTAFVCVKLIGKSEFQSRGKQYWIDDGDKTSPESWLIIDWWGKFKDRDQMAHLVPKEVKLTPISPPSHPLPAEGSESKQIAGN